MYPLDHETNTASMMQITIYNITFQKQNHQQALDNFINNLKEEKEFFNLNHERFKDLKLIIAAFYGKNIVGIAGLESKLGIFRSLIMVSTQYQGINLGKGLYERLMEEANKSHNLILAIIEENNFRSSRLHYALGFVLVGKRAKLLYFFKPLNHRGKRIIRIIQIFFPIIRIIDKIRK